MDEVEQPYPLEGTQNSAALTSQLLTREQILQADDIRVEHVPVPEWGGSVRVTAMTGTERDRFEKSGLIGEGRSAQFNYENFRARLVSRCIVDDAGARVFSDEDVEALGQKNGAALDRVYDVAARLSGIRQVDVEELVGNSGNGRSGSSTSD